MTLDSVFALRIDIRMSSARWAAVAIQVMAITMTSAINNVTRVMMRAKIEGIPKLKQVNSRMDRTILTSRAGNESV